MYHIIIFIASSSLAEGDGYLRIVDLTYTLCENMVVWPGNQRPNYRWLKYATSDFNNVTVLDMNAHTGTHVDSPLHFIHGQTPIDEIPLDYFWGKARLFRFKGIPNKQEITLKMVKDSCFSLGDATIFVLETGIQSLAEQRDYNFLFPIPAMDLLDWLQESGIKAFMTDATAIDYPEDVDESPRHKSWFRRGLPVVENLKNLAELPENKDFIICAMPLKLQGREGSPCRAAAWID